MSLSHWTEQEETQDISRGSGGEVFSTLLQDLPPIGQSQVVISEGGKIPGEPAGKALKKQAGNIPHGSLT